MGKAAMTCGICPEESDYSLCWSCLGRLRNIILGLRDIAIELQTQVTKQSTGAPTVGSHEGHVWQLPFDLAASDTADSVLDTLAYWCEAGVVSVDSLPVLQKTLLLADWHLNEYMRLGRSEKGPQMYKDFDSALGKSVRVIDRKILKVWLGDCECGRSVRAYPSKTTTLCPCGALWDVQESREKLRKLGLDQVVSAVDAEALGEVWGAKIKQATVRVWRHRGKIECLRAVCDKECVHIYRFGDLLSLHKAGTVQDES